MKRALVLLCVGGVAGCIRSPEDVPPLPEGRQITGTVVQRDLASGQLRPVAAVDARLRGGSFRTTSLEDGRFAIRRVPFGVHTLDLSVGERFGRPKAGRRITGLRIADGGVSVDLGQVEVGGVGDLTSDVRLEGLEDRPDAAAGALAVVAGTAFQAVVDLRGEFLLAGIPEGQFVVGVFRPGYVPEEKGLVPVTKNLVSQIRPYLLAIDPNAAPVRFGGAVDLDGEKGGVVVELIDEASTSTVYEPAMTDADGAYAFTAAPGAYRLRFTKDGYQPAELRGVLVFGLGNVVGIDRVHLAERPEDPDPSDPDNDGCTDDVFPNDPLRCSDRDGDGLDDSLDLDDDGDGLSDAEEASPGLDGFITDPGDADSDDDGVMDGADVCPVHPDPGQEDADGDGIGDACASLLMGSDPRPDLTPDGPPTITGFSPSSAPPGAIVIIDGSRFHPVPGGNLVRFGPTSLAVVHPQLSSTPNQLRVPVPVGAMDGLIEVSNGAGTTRTPQAFVVLPGPRVTDVQPRRAEPGASVVLTGDTLDGSTVRVGTATVALTIDTATQLAFDAPDLPGTHTLFIRRLGGESVAPFPLEITDGPRVIDARPNPVSLGQPLLITGSGFMGSTIRFSPNEVAVPDALSDTSIRVVVPDTAQSGPVTVTGPGGQSAAINIVVDPLLPFVDFQSHLMVEEGHTINLQGRHLTGASPTTVTIGGVSASMITPVGDIGLDVVVPSGAQAGWIELTVTNTQGVHVVRAPEEVSILRLLATAPSAPQHRGFAFSGTEIYSIEREGSIEWGRRYTADLVHIPGDDVNLNQTLGVTLNLVTGLAIADTGAPRRAVVISSDGSRAVTLPGFQPVGPSPCPALPSGGVSGDQAPNRSDGFRFSPDGLTAYSASSSTELIILDLVTGDCDVISGLAASGTQNFYFPPQIPGTNHLYLGGRSGGIGGVGIFDLTTRTAIEPFASRVTGLGNMFFFFDGNGDVWGVGGNTASLEKFDPVTHLSLRRMNVVGLGTAAAQTADQRFVFMGTSNSVYVLDLERERIATDGLMTGFAAQGLSAHPTQPRVMMKEAIGTPFRLYDIDVRP